LIEHLLVHRMIEDWAQRLDTPVEVAGHQVGRGDVDRRLRMRQRVPRPEAVDPPMLEEAADDGLDPYIVRQSWDAGPQAANAAHYEIDGYALPRRLVESIDHFWIDERIH